MFRFISLLCLFAGVAYSIPTGRVVNGTNAEEGEFPFIASLRYLGSHSCGCSIINENWVLTAAHCVTSQASSMSIQYGVNKISSTGENIANVAIVIRHKGYNPGNNYINDIALLKLAEPLKFNEKVQPVKLPEQGYEVPGGTKTTLSGWGLNRSGGSVQEYLQKVDLITFSDKECNERHGGRTHLSNICSGIPEGGKGQCNGDSGGPLIGNGFQLGIVSWSMKPCTIAPYPGVYTKVSHFIDWISEQIEENS